MNTLWYYSDGQQTFGPLPEEQIIDLIQSGQLTGDHFIVQEDSEEWQPLSASRFGTFFAQPAPAKTQNPQPQGVAPARLTGAAPAPARTPAPRSAMPAVVQAHRELNRNLVILGSLALLTLGGLGIFLASRKAGNTHNTRQSITNQIINNSYFTQLIASGATTEKDLEAITDIRPYGDGFVGISKEPLAWNHARGLAKRTGSEILSVTESANGSRSELLKWISENYGSHLSSTVWVMQQGEVCVLDGPEVLAATAGDRQRKAFVRWAPIDSAQNLPKPDGKPADMSKPVKVFILMGQVNMVGMGKITGGEGSLENAVMNNNRYPYLVDDAGNWSERKDVRYVRVMDGEGGGMQLFNNEWMTIKSTKAIGPEFGIGHVLGSAIDAPVMILKSCIGNRSLGWDLLPPGSERFEANGKIYAGYKDSPDSWAKGTEPKPIAWYAGKQYDADVTNAKKVIAKLDNYYPGAKGYEVAGFFFWQGEKDGENPVHASRYEQNLVRFIKQLRKDFTAPNAKFVLATLGEATKGSGGNGGMVLKAQFAVDGTSGKYPEFKGNVATVYSNPLSHGGSGNSFYDRNAETYMNVGEAMGKAMAELLKAVK